MRRIPQLTLAALVMAATACSPACTPPEPKDPDPKSTRPGPEAGDGEAAASPTGDDDMIMEAKGVDLRKLSESQRSAFFQVINTEPSACDKPHSLATSVRDDATCRDSLIVAQFIADGLGAGATPSQLKERLEFVVDSLKPRKIDIEGSPVYGSETAPVTVVVFADFECPHCKMEAPVLRKAVEQFKGRAKLVFKHFPLSAHPRAKQAAIATVAAQEQGKFWEMHDVVFAHQTALSDDDLQGYAEQVGLDIARFQRDLADPASEQRVSKDRAEGEDLEISGTPAVFVDGRYYHDMLFGGSVVGWIDEALKR